LHYLADVVCPDVVPLLVVHHTLEHRAENHGRYLAPAKRAAFDQGVVHGAVEVGAVQSFGEQLAVDVGEPVKLFVYGFRAFVLGLVQHFEYFLDVQGKIASVLAGASMIYLLNIFGGLKMLVSSANRRNIRRTRYSSS